MIRKAFESYALRFVILETFDSYTDKMTRLIRPIMYADYLRKRFLVLPNIVVFLAIASMHVFEKVIRLFWGIPVFEKLI